MIMAQYNIISDVVATVHFLMVNRGAMRRCSYTDSKMNHKLHNNNRKVNELKFVILFSQAKISIMKFAEIHYGQ